MLLRTLLFLIFVFPNKSFCQKEINLNDLELYDVEVPSLSDLEKLELFIQKKPYPSDREAVFEKKGGIHEKFTQIKYPEIPKEEIIWKDNFLPSKNESYYLYFSAGFGNISYSGSLPITSAPALDLNLFGIFWPKFNQQFLVGMVFDLTMNQLELSGKTTNVYQHALSLSMNYFFGKNVGSGLFARLDLGFGTVAYLRDEPSEYILDYVLGGSVLIGAGFAFPYSNEERLLFNIDFIKKLQTYSNSDNSSNLGVISLGILL